MIILSWVRANKTPYAPRGLRANPFFSRKTCQTKVWRSQGVPKHIAPSRKEEALTPRYRVGLSRGKWFLRPRDTDESPRSARTKAYRAVAKRKSAYAAMLVFTVTSVFSVFSVRTRFFQKPCQTKVWRSQADSAHSPKKLGFPSVFSPCSLCSLCDPLFSTKHAKLKFGVPRHSQDDFWVHSLIFLVFSPFSP